MQILRFLFLSLLILAGGSALKAQFSDSTHVMIMEIRESIDPRMSRYVELALTHAKEIDADVVIVDMDTYGGAVYDAEKIRTEILNLEIPIYVFINKNAASAGALISIACDSIFMSPGSNIGAATVVTQDGAAAPDKYQSYMRSMMRSTAEENGRNPKIAEAMVDENLEVEGISEKGEVITFTTKEAIKYGYCEAEIKTLDELYEHLGIKNPKVDRFKISSSEKVIAFFLNPIVKSVLVLLIMAGLYFEFQTPGIGFPLAIALMATVAYFVPDYLNGLLSNWELAMFGIGLILLALEIFVIPGFGVAGVAGIVMILASLGLSMLNNDDFDFTFVSGRQIINAITVIVVSIFGGILFIGFGGAVIYKSAYFKKISLQDVIEKKSVSDNPGMEGKVGKAYTVLRPSGKIEIEGEIYDATTRGDYVMEGEKVKVLHEHGATLIVRKYE